jgi:aldehyde:ferredoxin oxidoreductase
MEFRWEDLNVIGDRVFNLTRAFWVREFGKRWTFEMDFPPARWFEEPLSKGPMKGMKLDRAKYDCMLQTYYRKRGWDGRGIPKKLTLSKLGLKDVAQELKKHVKLVE